MITSYRCPKCHAVAQGNYCSVCGAKLAYDVRDHKNYFNRARRRVEQYAWNKYGSGSYGLGDFCFNAALTFVRWNGDGKICEAQAHTPNANGRPFDLADDQRNIAWAEQKTYELIDRVAEVVQDEVRRADY